MLKGIRQRGKKWAIDKLHKGHRLSGSYDTQKEAEEALKARILEIDTGVHAPESTESVTSWTLSQAYQETLRVIWSGTKGEATAIKNSNMVMKILGPQTRITEITTDTIDDLIEKLKASGNTGATINRKLAALSKILRTATEKGKLKAVPLVRRQRESEGRISFLTYDEEEQILKHLSDWGYPQHHDATAVLIDTGMRTGELWSLTARGVDFKQGNHGVITLAAKNTKTSRFRVIPLSARAAKILRDRIGVCGIGTPLFELDNFSYGYIWNKVREVMGRLEDPDFVPYICRHTCLTRLVKAGFPLAHVMRWAGHRTMTVTLRYAKVMPEDLYGGTKLLDDLRENRL